jgi:hypothetical protein
MTNATLRETIQGLLASHPDIAISSHGHTVHAERYLTKDGAPIGYEPDLVHTHNIWVRVDSVDALRLVDIESIKHLLANFHVSKPNHNLFGEPAFKNANLICFKVRSSWEAVRVIAEVAGIGSR